MADYRGLSVKEMQELRDKLRDAGGEPTVYKNSLTQIAMRELAMPSMDEFLAGRPLRLHLGDPVAPAKALLDFAKEHEALEVKGGLVEDRRRCRRHQGDRDAAVARGAHRQAPGHHAQPDRRILAVS